MRCPLGLALLALGLAGGLLLTAPPWLVFLAMLALYGLGLAHGWAYARRGNGSQPNGSAGPGACPTGNASTPWYRSAADIRKRSGSAPTSSSMDEGSEAVKAVPEILAQKPHKPGANLERVD